MAHGVETPPNIAIDGYTLEVVENFTYLGRVHYLHFVDHRLRDQQQDFQGVHIYGPTEAESVK